MEHRTHLVETLTQLVVCNYIIFIGPWEYFLIEYNAENMLRSNTVSSKKKREPHRSGTQY